MRPRAATYATTQVPPSGGRNGKLHFCPIGAESRVTAIVWNGTLLQLPLRSAYTCTSSWWEDSNGVGLLTAQDAPLLHHLAVKGCGARGQLQGISPPGIFWTKAMA